MSTALLLIATGLKYWDFAHGLINSAQEFLFPHDVILFTDCPGSYGFNVEYKIQIPSAGYPASTLNRYHTFLSQDSLLSQYDHLFYCDVDMRFVAPASESDILSDGITATLHPGFAVPKPYHHRNRPHTVGTPERRPESACYIPKEADNKYFCGGFNGGTSSSFLEMAANIRCMINNDADKGIVPIWHDESGLNRYLYDRPPVRVLTPSFCYPENYKGQYGWAPSMFNPVLLALDKDQSDRWGTR